MKTIKNYIKQVLLEQEKYFKQASESKYAFARYDRLDATDEEEFYVYDATAFEQFLEHLENNHADINSLTSFDLEDFYEDFKKQYNKPILISFVGIMGMQYKCYDHAQVRSSAAVNGSKMGIVAYDAAMFYATQDYGGLFPDRESLSGAAKSVWKKYDARTDIEKLKFDDIKNPKTPPLEDDCDVYDENDEYLNYSYVMKKKPQHLDVLEQNHELAKQKFGDNQIMNVLQVLASALFTDRYGK